MSSKSPLVRLKVNLNEETADALKAMAAKGGGITETIRRAVSLLKFVEDEQARGNRVQIAGPDGRTRVELELLR